MWRDGWDDELFERRRDLDPGGGGGPSGGEEPGDAVPPRAPGGEAEGGPPPREEPWDPPEAEGGRPPTPGESPEEAAPIGRPGGGGEGEEEGPGGPPTVVVRIYEWRTAQDARVCPICGPLDGGRWEDDDGPFPPAHVGCRCARVLVATETRTPSRRVPLGGGDGARRRWR